MIHNMTEIIRKWSRVKLHINQTFIKDIQDSNCKMFTIYKYSKAMWFIKKKKNLKSIKRNAMWKKQ